MSQSGRKAAARAAHGPTTRKIASAIGNRPFANWYVTATVEMKSIAIRTKASGCRDGETGLLLTYSPTSRTRAFERSFIVPSCFTPSAVGPTSVNASMFQSIAGDTAPARVRGSQNRDDQARTR